VPERLVPPAVLRLVASAQRERARREAFQRPEHVTVKRQRPKCGAKTRQGTPCQAPAVWDRERDRPRNGRCRMHGGLSTGPRTPEGRRVAAENVRRRNARRRAADQDR
jgi:hypothetical protein